MCIRDRHPRGVLKLIDHKMVDPVTGFFIYERRIATIDDSVEQFGGIGQKKDIAVSYTHLSHWKPYLENLHVCMSDATCYESHMRLPTDMKLLWESIEWRHRHIWQHGGELGIRRPRKDVYKRQG